jgi:UrcA family protein
MHASTHVNARFLVFTATLACALCGGVAAARDHEVPVVLHISTQGLDLSQPADARTFYTRLENAAWVVCTRGTRADLVPVDNPIACYESSLGSAIHAAQQPLLTRLYLANHTLQEAAAHGIDLSVVAAK